MKNTYKNLEEQYKKLFRQITVYTVILKPFES